MTYKISGTKSETTRVFVLDESDWSIEYNSVISGSGDYAITTLSSGIKTVFGRTSEGEVIGYGRVDAMEILMSSYTFLLYDDGDATNFGVVLEAGGSQSDLGANFSYAYRSAILPDKRVVVVGRNTSTEEVVVKCFLAGTTTEDWSYTVANHLLYTYADVCVLTNGNIVVLWGDYDDEYIYFVILDSDGGLVQGVTNADTDANTAYEDEGFDVTALADGGFFCHWMDDDESTIYGSIWNSNGTNRQATTWLDGSDYDFSSAIQFASGSIVIFEMDNKYAHFYSPTDLSDVSTYNDYSSESMVDYVYSAKLSTDKIALVFEASDGNTYGSVLNDTGSKLIEDKLILSSSKPVSFMALPDGTFLMQVAGGSEHGQNYYILDADLNTVSGPTAAFTGITDDTYYYYLKGCAG
ncbi:hypothetical protein DRQ25_01705 [Candidatus Fermentibacteria bacterium]|nr:MAG: hypothetical protein DRQ25_01705 [Candidatus Fermentibacteria bacterium]